MGNAIDGVGSQSFPSPETPIPLRQLAAVAPSQHRPRKMKSLVWTHFVKLVINGEQKAKCLHCHRLFSGNSKNGTSHLKDHMTRRCPRRLGQVLRPQKMSTLKRRQEVSVTVEENDTGLEHSPVCLVVEDENILRTREFVEEPKLVINCHSDGHEQGPVCVDGASQCSEQECGSMRNLVVKATYKEDTVRFDFPSTSSVDELEKELAKNLKLGLNNFKMKYQDEDKEWMLMTVDSHLGYVLNLTKSSGSNVIRLLVCDL